MYDFRLVTSYTLCRLLSASYLCVQQTAVWLLLAVTINCYVAIRYPFHYGAKYTKGVVTGSVGLAVSVASLQTTVVFTVADMYPVWSSLGDRAFCLMRFVEDFMLHYYVFFIFGKVLPLALMCVVYIYLFSVVRRIASQVGPDSGAPENGNGSAAKSSTKSKDAAKRFGLIVLVYVLCMIPVEVMSSLQVWPGWYCGISCKQLVALMRQIKPLADSILFTYKNKALKKAAIATARCRSVESRYLMSDAPKSTTKE